MEYKIKRIGMALIGVVLTGISIAMFKTSNFGTDPFSCFNLGVWEVSKLPYSIVYVSINAILLVGIFFLDKHYIGISTVLNMLLIGIIVEKSMGILSGWLQTPSLLVRIILLLLAIVIMCFAASLYFTADLGVSTYDAWALLMAKKKIAPFKLCRISTDLLCILAGVVMGVFPGIGTVITALGMGPLIETFNIHFSRPFLNQSVHSCVSKKKK